MFRYPSFFAKPSMLVLLRRPGKRATGAGALLAQARCWRRRGRKGQRSRGRDLIFRTAVFELHFSFTRHCEARIFALLSAAKNIANFGLFFGQKSIFGGPTAAKTSMPAALTFLLGAACPKKAPRAPLGTLLGRPWGSLSRSWAGPAPSRSPKSPSRHAQNVQKARHGSQAEPVLPTICFQCESKNVQKTVCFAVFFRNISKLCFVTP